MAADAIAKRSSPEFRNATVTYELPQYAEGTEQLLEQIRCLRSPTGNPESLNNSKFLTT